MFIDSFMAATLRGRRRSAGNRAGIDGPASIRRRRQPPPRDMRSRASCSSRRTSSSDVWVKSSYGAADRAERLGLVRRTRRDRRCARVSTAVSGGATGSATMMRSGSSRAQRRDRGPHRRPGGHAVVDDDRRSGRAIVGGDRRLAEALLALPRARRPRSAERAVELVDREIPRPSITSVVADDDVARSDRPHRQLLVPGHADLAHDDHVEFEIERPGDLGGDRNAATRAAPARSASGELVVGAIRSRSWSARA